MTPMLLAHFLLPLMWQRNRLDFRLRSCFEASFLFEFLLIDSVLLTLDGGHDLP